MNLEPKTRYFEIDDDHALARDFKASVQAEHETVRLYREFAKMHGISARYFGATPSDLIIVPEQDDLKKFKDQFVRLPAKDGGRRFKRRSPIFQEWMIFLALQNHKILAIPNIFEYVPIHKGQSELMLLGDKVYGRIHSQDTNIELPCSFREISASAYYFQEETFLLKAQQEECENAAS